MSGGLYSNQQIRSVASSAGVLVLLLVLLQGTNQVRGSLRECGSSIYIYCEETDSCEAPYSCDSSHCPRFGDISCDGGKTCYSYLSDRCDGQRKCTDGADEQSCGSSCRSSQTSCDNGQTCYSSYDKCDGVNDCTDGADEADCPSCATYQTECTNHNGCYSSSDRCDGYNDCSDESDERDCPNDTTESSWGSKVGLSSGSIIGIVIGVIVLSLCVGACKYYCRKTSMSPGTTNTANYFVPQSSAMATQNQPFQTTHTYSDGQTTTGPHNPYYTPHTSIHHTVQPPTNSNAPYPSAQYPAYMGGGYQPVEQPTAPFASDRSIPLPQTAAAYPPPSAPSEYQPVPPATDAAPPPSYESLYAKKKKVPTATLR